MSSDNPTKLCSKCQQHKSVTDFYVSNRHRDGYAGYCKSCSLLTAKQWKLENKDRYDAKQEEYRTRNKERIAAVTKQYALNNTDVRKKSFENYKTNNRQRYLETSRARANRRRALKNNALGTFTVDDLQVLYQEQSGCCAYCGINLHHKYDVDHIHPISRGGSNWPDNLALACETCNASKSDKTPEEWQKVRGW